MPQQITYRQKPQKIYTYHLGHEEMPQWMAPFKEGWFVTYEPHRGSNPTPRSFPTILKTHPSHFLVAKEGEDGIILYTEEQFHNEFEPEPSIEQEKPREKPIMRCG